MANRLRWPTRAAEPASPSTRARGAAVEAAARDYLARNDSAHRGGAWERVRRDVFSALPSVAKAAANR